MKKNVCMYIYVYVYIHIYISESLCYISEINIVNQLYFNKINFKNKGEEKGK